MVIVTESEYRRAEAVFAHAPGMRCVPAPADEETLADAIRLQRAFAAVVGVMPYRDGLYAALRPAGVIARFGVGHDGIDKGRATRAGILCTNTPQVLNQSVAELTILLLLSAARHVPALDARMRTGEWLPIGGRELHGRTLAIIGAGRIGQAVADIAERGLGMRVVRAGRHDDFTAAVSGADFVSLHVPATPETRDLIDAEKLAAMRSDAWLINTARGSVVDERALYDALAARTIAGAALDVFQQEPYVPIDASRDLRTLPNVILTPHVGSNTVEANTRMAERALRNVRLAHGRDYALLDLLNPEVLQSRHA